MLRSAFHRQIHHYGSAKPEDDSPKGFWQAERLSQAFLVRVHGRSVSSTYLQVPVSALASKLVLTGWLAARLERERVWMFVPSELSSNRGVLLIREGPSACGVWTPSLFGVLSTPAGPGVFGLGVVTVGICSEDIFTEARTDVSSAGRGVPAIRTVSGEELLVTVVRNGIFRIGTGVDDWDAVRVKRSPSNAGGPTTKGVFCTGKAVDPGRRRLDRVSAERMAAASAGVAFVDDILSDGSEVMMVCCPFHTALLIGHATCQTGRSIYRIQ